ncbi:MAG: hypothetical protein NVS2B12_34760 [Ktedonobacteraceae bacterium]
MTLARVWVRDNYGRNAEHLLKAEEWLRRINPDASQAMLLATLTHDMERAFPGPDSPKADPTRGPDDPIYNNAHSERSARIVSAFLREHDAPVDLVTEVAQLICVHEFGGWPAANWVQAVDSLSFLEVNIELFLHFINPSLPEHRTPAEVRAKFDWMYDRIQIPAAYSLAMPLYEVALEKLHAKEALLAQSQRQEL